MPVKWPFVLVCMVGTQGFHNKQYLTIMTHYLNKENPANILGKCHHAAGGQQTQSGIPI